MSKKQVIDDATLQRVAEVCRLRLSEGERERFKKDLNEILAYFSQIGEIEAKGRELYYIQDLESVARKDESRECGEAEGIRKAFAKSKGGAMLAPKSL